MTLFDINDVRQGIVHVIGPENGYTQPGMTIVCGDSHTATHGAFGSLAFGIGTSEVEHVLATQTLLQFKPKTFELRVDGELGRGVTAKDMILYLIGQIGTAGGTGYVLEYTGDCVSALTMEERMTVCNMSIEAGARAGMIAPDQTTFDYLDGLPESPKDFAAAIERWKQLPSDPGANLRQVQRLPRQRYRTAGHLGNQPRSSAKCQRQPIPDPSEFENLTDQKTTRDSLDYMGLTAGTPIQDVKLDRIFIGSCTNARIEDLRAAAAVLKGHHVSSDLDAMVVPGSGRVKLQAEKEGLHHDL